MTLKVMMANRPALSKLMNEWRSGARPLPPQYVEIHKASAEASLKGLKEQFGLRVLFTEMVRDGWMDGMQVLRAVCESQSHILYDLRWTDSGGGSWFHQLSTGGSTLFYTPTERPGYL